MAKTKKPSRKLDKMCVVCGKDIKVILYQDRSYRGGHYFGKMSIPTKPEIEKGSPPSRKPAEYWECPKCYWNYNGFRIRKFFKIMYNLAYAKNT